MVQVDSQAKPVTEVGINSLIVLLRLTERPDPMWASIFRGKLEKPSDYALLFSASEVGGASAVRVILPSILSDADAEEMLRFAVKLVADVDGEHSERMRKIQHLEQVVQKVAGSMLTG
ncbi:MAG: hypothetical protein ACLP36_13395 [Acidimicrobiales bacterium]|jgi:hypothetical protein